MSVCWAFAIEAHSPIPTYAAPQADAPANEELELLKEEETVSIATRHEQPISQAPSNVYVITDEDIRHSGATDIPKYILTDGPLVTPKNAAGQKFMQAQFLM